MARTDDVLDLSKRSRVGVEGKKAPDESTSCNESQLYCWQMTLHETIVLDLSQSAKKNLTGDSSSSSSSSSCSSTTSVHLSSTEKMNSKRKTYSVRHLRDASYYERRRKNNLAAKKSRDAKRKREAAIQARVIILEEENRRMREYLSACCCQLEGVCKKHDFGR